MNMLDDDLVARVRAALDELTDEVASVPPQFGSVIGLTEEFPPSHRDRRRVLVLAAAAIALLMAIAGALVLLHDRRGDVVGTPDTSATTVSPVVTTVGQPMEVHPVPPIPDGWELVDWGNVRLAVPPDLSPFRAGNGCGHSTADGVLRITCGNRSVEVGSASSDGTVDACTRCRSVPGFDTTVSVDVGDDALAQSILGTVGPSGTWRYQNEPRPAPPADWKTVAFDDVTIRVPADWSTDSTADDASSTCPHELRDRVVQLDHGQPTDCGPVIDLRAPTDGVRLYRAEPPIPTEPGGAEQVISSKSGTSPTVVVEVGFGADPNVGLAILNSMQSQPEVDGSTPYLSIVKTDLPVLAIGESVMLGAAPVMEGRGIHVSAEVSKGPSWEVEQLQQALQRYNITYGVVIQLGTNGAVTRQQYEDVLALVPAQVKRVVVLTVHADRPWIAANNELIRSLPATHPNVVVLDWDAEAQGPDFVGHLSSDGIHLRDDTAKQAYTNLILTALGLAT